MSLKSVGSEQGLPQADVVDDGGGTFFGEIGNFGEFGEQQRAFKNAHFLDGADDWL